MDSYAVLQDFITDIEAQDLRRTEQSVQQSVLLVREKYEATKVLEVGDKVIELKRIRGSYKRSWCLLLAWFWCHQH
jgi:hypothetical protein